LINYLSFYLRYASDIFLVVILPVGNGFDSLNHYSLVVIALALSI